MSRLVSLLLATGIAAVAASPCPFDTLRAQTKVPRDGFRGGFYDQSMAEVLNGHLKKLFGAESLKPCHEWSVEELHMFQEKVFSQRDAAFDEIYQDTDDNRRMRFPTIEAHRADWATNAALAGDDAELEVLLVHGHCHEAVMWLIHHLPSAQHRQQLTEELGMKIPTLSEATPATKDCGASMAVDDAEAAANRTQVCAAVKTKESCSWCHSKENEASTIPNALLPQFHGPDDADPKCMAKHVDDGQSWKCDPHGWSRMRRCDQDYHPRCGMCEGLGGVATSDSDDKIVYPACSIVANASVHAGNTTAPLYPKKFTASFSEILIGRKRDPACFVFFPENNSTGTLCYRAEKGFAYYDIEKEAVHFNYTQVKLPGPIIPGVFPNISSQVIHVGEFMWIVNRYPTGVHQCICTDPTSGDDPNHTTPTYPWRFDFARDAAYLGRERLHVEFLDRDMELDHFNIWAHHLWTDPVSRRLVRAWKPWNGLEVFDPDRWQDGVIPDDAFHWLPDGAFDPPDACKKGTPTSATFRIKCTDDGHFNGGGKSIHEEVAAQHLEIVEHLKAKGAY